MFVNIGGTWRRVTDAFVNVGGTWRKVGQAFINIAGTWRSFWSGGTLAPQFPVIISQSTNTTTGLITLTGTNYYWSPGPPSLTYRFQWWNGTSWSDISTNTAVNPSYGSSTSYTQLLQSSGPSVYVQPNQLNRFRFRVEATYGTESANSNSSETTIQGPTNVTLTAGTATVTSVQLSWSASTGANRYMVYYSTDNSTFILYAGTNSLSITVSGLTSNTLYYFKVIPITGTTNNTGYYGSYSNTVSSTTLTDLANTALPTISGTIKEGQTVTGSNGSWNITPDSYSYQWLYFDQIGVGYDGYLPISGATSSSYLIPSNYRSVYGTSIRFRVTAVKSGYTTTNAYSLASTVAALATIPDAPTGASGTNVGTNRPYGNGAVNLSWTAPANTGGVSLTGYKIQFQVPGVGTTWYNWSANTTDTSSTSITLTGLGAVGYKFRIYSVNSIGQSSSASETTTISITTVPQSPTIGTSSTFNGYVLVTYTSGADGGSAINTYTATSSPGSISGSTSSGSIVVTGLTHNTAYTFTVTATNANGTSLPSSSSNTAYGVNVGSPTITSSSVNGRTITLGFSPGSNSTSTRAYINGSLDGSTTSSSYPFVLPSYSTTYTLGLAGVATVGGTLYQSSTTSGSYTTGAAPVAPSAANTGASTFATSLQIGGLVYVGSQYSSASPSPTYTYQLQYATSAGGTYNNQSGGSTGSYTLQAIDVPNQYFRYRITATNSAGSYTFTTNYVGPTVSSGVAPSNPGTPTGTYSFSGGNYNIAWSWTASSGTTPITYYYSVYSATSDGGALSLRASGSTTGTTYSSSWNSTTYGVYGVLKIYAQNSYGRAPSSGTIDSVYT